MGRYGCLEETPEKFPAENNVSNAKSRRFVTFLIVFVAIEDIPYCTIFLAATATQQRAIEESRYFELLKLYLSSGFPVIATC